MSLIESALEKLRRDETRTQPTGSAVPSRPVVVPMAASEPIAPARHTKVDLQALRVAGYLPELGLERRFADHYRQIKRPLIEKALNGSPEMRLILVSSALPGDGKTFTSINLALSMARERDLSVLLVDADTPKARVSEVLGIREERGLVDTLMEEALDVESLVHSTDIHGLEILAAGKRMENTTELLASARMAQIAARLIARNTRRLVLFDTAPLLVSSEARALLRIPGQIVLVARSGVTPRQALVDALVQVDKSRLQGLVINEAPFRAGSGYYDYGGYGTEPSET